MAPRVEARQPPAFNHLNAAGSSPSAGISKVNGRKKANPPASRASSSGISTNVSAYPRTDPIHALNALLKLVTSLPGRIGGCQYKLTPAEQALSVHLVGILEPFVYQGARALGPGLVSGTSSTTLGHNLPAPPSISLIQQPTEILDAILFYVDQKKDLLNIGLACKRLSGVVFPRHFEYRVIRCKASTLPVWNHLIKHRSLARNVRKLEILDERVSGSTSTTRASGSSFMIPRGILETDTDLESTDDELTMHSKQERYLISALTRMTALNEFKWSCNHSPLSFLNLWSTLTARAGAGLQLVKVTDNMAFAPKLATSADGESESDETSDDDSADEQDGNQRRTDKRTSSTRKENNVVLPHLRSVTIQSTNHSYGAVKQPELGRISEMLHQCVNLKELDISYSPPRGNTGPSGPAPVVNGNAPGFNPRTKPVADEFLLYSRWIPTLTHLSLKNLRCMSSIAPSAFLADHSALEVLSLDIVIHHNTVAGTGPPHLPPGSLPRLREIRAPRDVINAILQCPCDTPRPLEVIKGFKLYNQGNNSRAAQFEADFLANIKQASSTIRRVELSGWHDMEEVRRLATCVPGVQHLDIGKRLGGPGGGAIVPSAIHTAKNAAAPATNHMEWAETLGTLLPDLVAFHGVKFFYEVSSGGGGGGVVNNTPARLSEHNSANSDSGVGGGGVPAQTSSVVFGNGQSGGHNANLSNMERSRMRKNDEIAGVLAWKCKKLRRVDHWEDGSGKVIVLLRERDGGHVHGEEGSVKGKGKERDGKVRWEIRRLKI
ncbi:hypothetical protein CVT24_003268 [Panaeolus cyanescens]|uniref:F-box domain-containing protein n=1 Tax=Panaeolus cyanescens TaxID=181874 RepID=A0A409YR91_9AGAR|nr:hypothetical protein CVT24_003268 [Panaeolus cyanescens]